MKKTTGIPIRGIDTELLKEIKIEAIRKNTTIGAITNEAWMLWLGKGKKQMVRNKK